MAEEKAEDLLVGVGEIFHNLRLEAGLTQRQAAKLLGTTQAEVSYMETGAKKDIKLSTLLSWANFYEQEFWIFITPPEEAVE